MNAHSTQEEISYIATLSNLEKVIITSWESQLRKYLDPSKQEAELILKDHMPEILKTLKEYLENKDPKGDAEFFGKAHGFQRAVMTEFNLIDLLKEYSILREVLIFNLYPMGNMHGATKLHRFLDDLLINAVDEFIKQKAPHERNALVTNLI